MNAINRRNDANQVRYKFGVRVPRTYGEAMTLDKENGNNLSGDATRRELEQIFSYKSFHDLGSGCSPGEGYKKIKVRLVFDVKADGRRKARLVARGDMTPEPENSVYSSVATLRSLRIIIFLAELNGLQLMQGDIGNAYLESYTQEKVYFTAGPEFGHLAGHNYIIDKALYRLRSSGLCFHECLSTILRKFGFHQSKVDPDVWMRVLNDMWEFIVVYVDNIIAAMNNPQSFFDELQGPNGGFTMKGVGSPTYHLGADFFWDDDGMLCMGTQTYAKQLCTTFESLYGEQPKTVFSPLDHKDHPELDDTPLCGPDDTAKPQSLISIKRFVPSSHGIRINCATNTRSFIHVCRILGLTALNSLLQYVNWLVWEGLFCQLNVTEQGSLVTTI